MGIARQISALDRLDEAVKILSQSLYGMERGC
jgi:hypothetical protein